MTSLVIGSVIGLVILGLVAYYWIRALFGLVLMILVVLVAYCCNSEASTVKVQTYCDNTTLINNNGVQCDVMYCDKFEDDDDVVFVSYDVIKNVTNGATCQVECGDAIQDSVPWYLWSVRF